MLAAIHEQRKSCCIHVTSPENETGRFLIKEGKIILVRFNNYRGLDSIDAIKNLPTIKYRIVKFVPMPKDRSLPDTGDIIDELLSQCEAPISSRVPISSRAQISSRAHGHRKLVTKAVSSKERQAVHDILNDILGPMAYFLMEDYVNEAHDLNEASANLSTELSEEDMEIFRDKLEQEISKGFR